MTGWRSINPRSSYWAGFMMADGYFHLKEPGRKKASTIVLQLAAKDKGHVDKLVNFLGVEAKPYPLDNNGFPAWRVDVYRGAKNQIQALMDNFCCGISGGKDFSLAGIPPEHRLSFLAGFIDGDGSVIWDDKGVKAVQLFGPLDFIMEAKGYLNELIPPLRPNRVKPQATPLKNGWVFRLQGPRAFQLVNLVQELGIPLLGRKWNKEAA